jgi:hypothetical protein
MRSCVFGLTLACLTAPPAAHGAGRKPAVSTGEYEILLGGQRIGQEQFRIFKKKGYTIESTRTLYWPEPARHEIVYELEPDLEPKKVELSVTRGGIVTEIKLERKGDRWRMETKGQGRDKKKTELGRREGTVVDMDSLLFQSLTLRRLALADGESRKVDAVTLALPDFSGARQQQTYHRVGDEDIETPFAGTITAQVYELVTGTATHRLWVAPSGAVVKASFERIGGEEEVVLVRLETPRGSFPP